MVWGMNNFYHNFSDQNNHGYKFISKTNKQQIKLGALCNFWFSLTLK